MPATENESFSAAPGHPLQHLDPDQAHEVLPQPSIDPLCHKTNSRQAHALYLSHALSTWHARTYEFAAIIYTAAAFPDTLLMSSLRGVFINLGVLLLSPLIGRIIDRSQDRLRSLVISIISNRLTTVLACLMWYLLLKPAESGLYDYSRLGLFGLAVTFGIMERLSGVGNMIAAERDWVPVLANEAGDYTLTHLNAVMRRIDLICKLISPLVISTIATLTSIRLSLVWIILVNVPSLFVEILAARRVWKSSQKLQAHKPNQTLTEITWNVSGLIESLAVFFNSQVWLPSLALALLHLSALSYAATFMTYLLTSGFTLISITVARTLGSVIEVSSTYMAPVGIRRLARVRNNKSVAEQEQSLMYESQHVEIDEHDTGLARSGLWGVTLQLCSLVPVVLAIWNLAAQEGDNWPAAIVMFSFLSLSRLGLWVFDLTTQEITQMGVREDKRSSFAGVEMGFVSLFELTQWVLGAVFPKPQDFPLLATGSLFAVTISASMYAGWVWRRRGHLVHWEKFDHCTKCCK